MRRHSLLPQLYGFEGFFQCLEDRQPHDLAFAEGPNEPSAIRTYDTALRLRILPELGGRRLSELRRNDLQEVVDDLIAGGLNASTIRTALMPVKVVCARALHRGELQVNPTAGLAMPAVRSRRYRIADRLREPRCSRRSRPTGRYGQPRCTRGCAGAS